MGRHKGRRGLVDMDLSHEMRVQEVYAAYKGTLKRQHLEPMSDNALDMLWESRPTEIEEGESRAEVVWEFDPKEAELEAREELYGPDGLLYPHRHDAPSKGWGK